MKIVGPSVKMNPIDLGGPRAKYVRVRKRSPRAFAKGAFRTITLSKRKGVKAVIGCPKGKFTGRRCRTGTRVQAMLYPKSRYTRAQAAARGRRVANPKRRRNPMPKTRRELETLVVRVTPPKFRERSGGTWHLYHAGRWQPVSRMPIQTLWHMAQIEERIARGEYRAPQAYRETVAGRRLLATNPKRRRGRTKPIRATWLFEVRQYGDLVERFSSERGAEGFVRKEKRRERRQHIRYPTPDGGWMVHMVPTHPYRRTAARRANPTLAILNPPMAPRLAAWMRRAHLSPAERANLEHAIERYRTFHGTDPTSITKVGQVPGKTRKVLVGMGETVDVSYQAHGKQFQGSNKRGVPWRHEFSSRPTMAVDPATDTIAILNNGRFRVADFIRD